MLLRLSVLLSCRSFVVMQYNSPSPHHFMLFFATGSWPHSNTEHRSAWGCQACVVKELASYRTPNSLVTDVERCKVNGAGICRMEMHCLTFKALEFGHGKLGLIPVLPQSSPVRVSESLIPHFAQVLSFTAWVPIQMLWVCFTEMLSTLSCN